MGKNLIKKEEEKKTMFSFNINTIVEDKYCIS